MHANQSPTERRILIAALDEAFFGRPALNAAEISARARRFAESLKRSETLARGVLAGRHRLTDSHLSKLKELVGAEAVERIRADERPAMTGPRGPAPKRKKLITALQQTERHARARWDPVTAARVRCLRQAYEREEDQ